MRQIRSERSVGSCGGDAPFVGPAVLSDIVVVSAAAHAPDRRRQFGEGIGYDSFGFTFRYRCTSHTHDEIALGDEPVVDAQHGRSEERRVGTEWVLTCRSR